MAVVSKHEKKDLRRVIKEKKNLREILESDEL